MVPVPLPPAPPVSGGSSGGVTVIGGSGGFGGFGGGFFGGFFGGGSSSGGNVDLERQHHLDDLYLGQRVDQHLQLGQRDQQHEHEQFHQFVDEFEHEQLYQLEHLYLIVELLVELRWQQRHRSARSADDDPVRSRRRCSSGPQEIPPRQGRLTTRSTLPRFERKRAAPRGSRRGL